ncbi:hypothetical protein [Candidatus Nitrosotenuis chungbukensis]|nr:hypothetical protein [Candidatus Nitrosotenuis chungbukensis]
MKLIIKNNLLKIELTQTVPKTGSRSQGQLVFEKSDLTVQAIVFQIK